MNAARAGGLALVAGLLHTGAFAPTGAWWLQILALALLFSIVETATPRIAALAGSVFGFGWLASGLWWLHISMHQFGGIPWLLAALAVGLLAAGLGLYYALALGLTARWTPPGRWRLLALVPAWLLAELQTRRPLLPPAARWSDATAESFAVFRMLARLQQEFGQRFPNRPHRVKVVSVAATVAAAPAAASAPAFSFGGASASSAAAAPAARGLRRDGARDCCGFRGSRPPDGPWQGDHRRRVRVAEEGPRDGPVPPLRPSENPCSRLLSSDSRLRLGQVQGSS